MGQRGKGARPTLTVVETAQSAFGFRQDEVSRLRSALPWEAEGLSRLDRVVAFLEDLPITQGSLSGTTLAVRDWQRAFLAEVYGEDARGRRPIRTAVLSMARKNGKTQLVAGLALCHLMGPEAEGRGEVYAAANDREQAGKCFAEMVAILDEHPELQSRVNVEKFCQRIEVLQGTGKGSIFAALSADATTKHGLSPSFIVYDDLGRLVASEGLCHDGNPILTFCTANAVIERDAAGNRKLAKHKSPGRIGGLMALAMALGVTDREGEDTLPACLVELMG